MSYEIAVYNQERQEVAKWFGFDTLEEAKKYFYQEYNKSFGGIIRDTTGYKTLFHKEPNKYFKKVA